MPESDPTSDVATLTVQLLSAYLSNNTVASDDLAELIRSTRMALTEDAAAATAQPEPETFAPAVSVRKSLASSEHIISLIDGKRYKTLKRHLASHGLTPETYRSRYGLPASYPMVAPDYAAHRRAVAQKIGLGSRKAPSASDKGETVASDPMSEAPAEDAPDAKQPAKRTRRGNGKTLKGNASAAETETAASEAAATTKDDTAALTETMPAPSRKSKPRASKAKGASSNNAGATDAGVTSAGASEDEAGTPSRRSGKAAPSSQGGEATDDAPRSDNEATAADKPARRKPAAKPKKPARMARPSKGESND